ncbi:MAG: hypothetical protein VX777_10015 [Chlamydiota bacterium]|nr:hypothetical protein [Chlamydiota bacterium]
MKFSLAKEHRDFFYTHQALELEELISESQLSSLRSSIKEFFKKKLNISERGRQHIDPKQLYTIGHDLWRDEEIIKKIIFHRRFAEMALELEYQAPFRIGFDQFIPSGLEANKTYTLHDLNSFQGTLCGFLICLKSHNSESEEQNQNEEFNPFSSTEGNVTFIAPDCILDFSKVPEEAEYLLVTYTQDKSVYAYNENDPHTNFLKKLGYGFGDRIKEETHPIVFRYRH